MWVEYSAVSVATDELLIADALMEINEADFPITEAYSEYDPQVRVYIQLDGTGDFIPFSEGTYEFTTSRFRITMTRDDNDAVKPVLESFTVYFHADGDQTTLQAQTVDATPVVMTTDKSTATALNTITLKDDSSLIVSGTVIARKSDGTEEGRYYIEATLSRGTGAASTAISTSKLTVLHETEDSWDISLLAETTLGGLSVQVTGDGASTVDWVADLNVREVG